MTRSILISKIVFPVLLALYPLVGLASAILAGSVLLAVSAVGGLLGAIGISAVLLTDHRSMKIQRATIEVLKERTRIQLNTIENQARTIGGQREQLDIYRGTGSPS